MIIYAAVIKKPFLNVAQQQTWLIKATSFKNLSFGGRRGKPGIVKAWTRPATISLQKDLRHPSQPYVEISGIMLHNPHNPKP